MSFMSPVRSVTLSFVSATASITALTVSCVASPCTESFTAAMISVLSALRSAVVAGMLDWWLLLFSIYIQA
jgi:hypothetical protein